MMYKPAHQPAKPRGQQAAATWRPLVRATVVAVLSVAGWTGVYAESLTELYQAARSYDAAYLSAKAQADSVQYQVAQARALMRPTLGLQASVVRGHFESHADSTAAQQQQQLLTGSSTFDNTSTSTTKKLGLQARQPLFNRTDSVKISQAEQNLIAADADLKNAEDDLAVRVTQAYFDVLSAQDVLSTAQTNKAALSEQLASAKRSFEVGNATITDTREAQARHDLAIAQEIAAVNDLRVKRLALDQLVGRADVKPSPLATPANLASLPLGEVDEWVGRTTSAPNVRKAEVALTVAKLEIDKARAGHLPTVDATASLATVDIDGTPTAQALGGAGNTANVGVELNMSLFSGFAVQNRIREVLVLQEKAERDLDNVKRGLALGTRQAFFGLQSGLAQVKAYEAAEASAKLALEATQLGYRVGVRINKDVLDAQTQLSTTQKDLYKARYDVIVGTVKLRQASGTLRAEDLNDLNKLLVVQ